MAECKTPVLPTLKVVEDSILTFECIARLSKDVSSNADITHLQFKDEFLDGLKYIGFTLRVFKSTSCTDCKSYELIAANSYYAADTADPLLIQIPKDAIFDADAPKDTFIKIRFKVSVDDLSALNCKFTNIGEFSTINRNPGSDAPTSPVSIIGSPKNVSLCKSIIEKYDFTVAGYSLNVCDDSCDSCLEAVPCGQCFSPCDTSLGIFDENFKQDFTAAFLFPAMNGDYGDIDGLSGTQTGALESTAEYVLTIKPTPGLDFPTCQTDFDKVKVSIASGCLCHGTEIDGIDVTTDGDGNLVIKIPHIGTFDDTNYNDDAGTPDNATCVMGGKAILVTIPYEIDECTKSPLAIRGSAQLIDTKGDDDEENDETLASIDNFCLCVNTKCSGLTGISKRIFC